MLPPKRKYSWRSSSYPFEYTSGKPTHIVDLRGVGDTIDVTDIYPEKIIKTNTDKIFPTYSSTLITYDVDILVRSPSIASTFFTLNDVTTEDKTFRFRYDRNGRMIEVTQHSKLSSATDFKLTIDYDKNGECEPIAISISWLH